MRSYNHRLAYGAWINDVRNEPLPLQGWPAPQFDDECVDSLIRSLEVQGAAGYTQFALWGLFSTYGYPPDVPSVLDDDRRRRLKRLFKAAERVGMKIMLGMGVLTWGYDEILKANESLRGYSVGDDGKRIMSSHAMCGSKEESWGYVFKILDFALSEFDFGGVHLESADQGWCGCPECAGKDGTVGYNCRLNVRCSDYIKDKWPDKVVTATDINWTTTSFNEEEKSHIIELSKHVDAFMDQPVNNVKKSEKREFIKKLHCDYAGTTLNFYPSVRLDRLSYFLPYPKRASTQVKSNYEDGERSALIYNAPINNPGTEVSIAVVGRMLSDVDREIDDTLAEVIELYYKPKTAQSRDKLADIIVQAEDAYFNQFAGRIQRAIKYWKIDPKAFEGKDDLDSYFMLDSLFATSPGPASFLKEPVLDAQGRAEYKKGLISVLENLSAIEDDFEDNGRIEGITSAVMITLTILNTIG